MMQFKHVMIQILDRLLRRIGLISFYSYEKLFKKFEEEKNKDRALYIKHKAINPEFADHNSLVQRTPLPITEFTRDKFEEEFPETLTGHFKQTYDQAQADESMRLAYVAITRAKKQCWWYGSPKPGGAMAHLKRFLESQEEINEQQRQSEEA